MNFLKVFIAFSALIISFPTFSQVDSLSYIEESNKAFIPYETLEKEEIEDSLKIKYNTIIQEYNTAKAELEERAIEIDSLTKVIENMTDNITKINSNYNQLVADYEEAENQVLQIKTKLQEDTTRFLLEIDELKINHLHLKTLNDTLSKLNKEYRIQLNEKNHLLEEKIKILQEKEILFAEKEQLYKDAINASQIDKTKIEGQVEKKNAQIEGKEREIDLLQKSINEKDTSLIVKDQNLNKITQEKEMYYKMADTLRNKLVETEKELLKIKEELKYQKQKAVEAQAKIDAATGRKKKVRVIQGIAMRFYPTPVWDIVPVATENGYENKVINRNTSKVDFDFITGASVILYDLTKPEDKFASDISVYVGFGGANLFKNFYVGGSYRFLDFFHVALGVNVSEYTLLAEEFNKEGQALKPGWSIQTTKEWKVTPFISLSLDFEFLSYIGKK
ncbi:MAG: hypothetical protein VB011_04870 [Bacteroidales bacterium]|nr:hypothetical protein [Bacteroidales bacterium]